jgi:hypothetical protein
MTEVTRLPGVRLTVSGLATIVSSPASSSAVMVVISAPTSAKSMPAAGS